VPKKSHRKDKKRLLNHKGCWLVTRKREKKDPFGQCERKEWTPKWQDPGGCGGGGEKKKGSKEKKGVATTPQEPKNGMGWGKKNGYWGRKQVENPQKAKRVGARGNSGKKRMYQNQKEELKRGGCKKTSEKTNYTLCGWRRPGGFYLINKKKSREGIDRPMNATTMGKREEKKVWF